MNTKKITTTFLLATLLVAPLASCMDKDWSDPKTSSTEIFGNPSIEEDTTGTILMTIADLKKKYAKYFTADTLMYQFTKSAQIKGVVTGNDIEGNMYNEISIQDETGAIFIGIAQGGICGYLPLGTEILVELNGLWIGNYRQSPTIGMPYTDKDGDKSVSRMSRHIWQNHFKLTGVTKTIEPELFADGSNKTKWSLDNDNCKLGILKNVTISKGGYYNSKTGSYVDNVMLTDSSTYAVPDFSTSWYFKEQPDGQNGGVQIYNSSFADFASVLLPHGKVNVTGVFKRYKNQWEIIIRSLKDIQPATGGEETPITPAITPAGTGTQADPFNVAAALAKCEETGTTQTENMYVRGYVISEPSLYAKNSNITFDISDTKEGANSLMVYACKGLGKANITSADYLKIGDEVVICGPLINYKGNTPEFTNGCYIISINGKTE